MAAVHDSWSYEAKSNFASLLLQLSNSLTRKELQELKFLCGGVVPRDRLETINHGFELFEALAHLNKLSVRDRDFLASKLIAVNRTDLRNQLLEIEDVKHPLPSNSKSDFRSLLLQLSNSLTGKELQALKFLCGDVLPRDKLETINHGFELFEALEHLNKLSVRDRDFLASKLIAVNRIDLRNHLLEIEDVEDPLPNFRSLSPVPPHLIGLTSAHQQSQQEDGWSLQSSASSHVPHKQYPGLQRYHPETVPVTVSTQVQPQEQAGSLRRYHPEPVPVTDSEQVAQKQPESLHHALSRVTGTVETFPRQLKPEQSIQEELVAPDPAAGAVANLQVNLMLKRHLQYEGCFLDPEKYDRVKCLGHGAYAREPDLQKNEYMNDDLDLEVDIGSHIIQAEHQAMVNTTTTGSPIEERHPFPNLNPLGPALPITSPTSTPTGTAADRQPQQPSRVPVPVIASLQEPQEQVEPVHHAASNASTSPTDHSTGSTRIPRPPGAVDTFSRQPVFEQATAGREVDVQDSGAVTDAQVDLELKGNLQSDGCFLDPEKYDPVKFLGSGGYAMVYLVVEKRTGKKMASKMCDLRANATKSQKEKRDAQKLVESMEIEVMALALLKHEHIVEFFFVEHIRNTALLFLEYMEGGTLEEFLEDNGPLEEPLVVKFTSQLLSAVNYLHTNGKKHIVHKDIKGSNILLDGAQKNIKLADFGICTIMEKLRTATDGMVTKNNVASFHWTSPELLGGETFTRNTDIWSVGCTVVEMLTTKPPLYFENLTRSQKMFRIVNNQIEPPTDCTSLAFGFLKRCLCPKETRASAAELLVDPYLNQE